jgi:bifunctional DNA-binding transcriptional regulator/antitoxin component of YhaV-PrlF toxin-antitoxin module
MIPKELRERGGLQPRAEVEFALEGDRAVLAARRDRPRLAGSRRRQDYSGVFASLVDGVVLQPDLAERVGDAAGRRNLLVHEYADMDHGKLWAALDNLDDLRAFATAAAREAGL